MTPTETPREAALPPTTPRPARRGVERAILWLEGLLAVGAYVGAIGFLTGGLDIGSAAERLPFGSLAFAGVMLGLINGVLPTVVLIGALRGRPWAQDGHLVVGVALVAWIIVQIAILGPPLHPLQGIYLAWGWILVALAVRLRLPGTTRHPTPGPSTRSRR